MPEWLNGPVSKTEGELQQTPTGIRDAAQTPHPLRHVLRVSEEKKPRRCSIPHPGLLLVVALVSVVIAIDLSLWLPYHRQQAAIREIERLGVSFTVQQGGPEWLRDVVGDDWMKCFDSVVFLNLDGTIETKVSDDGLKHLSGLTNLQVLILWDIDVGDDGLKHLSGLTNLEALTLEGTQVTGDGLKHLSGLTNLGTLHLEGKKITDDGLKHLSGLTNLLWLSLKDTQVSDDGVKMLQQKLPRCQIGR